MWLWDQVMPDILDEDGCTAFVGIGTLLNQKMVAQTPDAQKRIIFSSGAGYGKRLKNLDESFTVYCVRGPITARMLNLPLDLAIADAGILIRKLYQPSLPKRYKFSYMPHYNFAGEGWRLVCEQIDFGYIDPCLPTEEVLDQISSSEILLTEAMHGAIAADALRVPWIPVINHPIILALKWQDWCSSMGLYHSPHYIDYLNQPNPKIDPLTPIRQVRDSIRQRKTAKQLLAVAKSAKPMLSDINLLDNLVEQLLEKIEILKKDVIAGKFV